RPAIRIAPNWTRTAAIQPFNSVAHTVGQCEPASGYGSMGREQECPLSTQLPVSASVIGRQHVVVGGDVGIDCLMTDLEDAPDAAADRQRQKMIVIGTTVGGDEGARSQIPALGEVIIEEGLQRHFIDVSPILISSKRPEIKDQEPSRDVSRPVGQEDDKAGSGGIL